MLLWPTVALLGFVALGGLVIALGRESTARYEGERDRLHDARQQPAAVAAGEPSLAARAPAAGVTASGPQQPGGTGGGTAPGPLLTQRSEAGGGAHPAGVRTVERASGPAWWLIDDSADGRALAGPFVDRFDADWAGLATGRSIPTRVVYGSRRADGALSLRQPPHEREWLHELGGHLARLPEDWDELLSDDDPLTTLVVEVAAALVEAGLQLYDGGGRGPESADPSGGVCLTPDVGAVGVLVSWRPHERMSLQQARGATAGAALQQTMNTALARVLMDLGFEVESIAARGCYRVTAAPTR